MAGRTRFIAVGVASSSLKEEATLRLPLCDLVFFELCDGVTPFVRGLRADAVSGHFLLGCDRRGVMSASDSSSSVGKSKTSCFLTIPAGRSDLEVDLGCPAGEPTGVGLKTARPALLRVIEECSVEEGVNRLAVAGVGAGTWRPRARDTGSDSGSGSDS